MLTRAFIASASKHVAEQAKSGCELDGSAAAFLGYGLTVLSKAVRIIVSGDVLKGSRHLKVRKFEGTGLFPEIDG